MCTRQKAIEIIISEKSGSKHDLSKKIGHFYDAFLTMGFIREKVSILKSGVSAEDRIQWETTPLATKRVGFLVE